MDFYKRRIFRFYSRMLRAS